MTTSWVSPGSGDAIPISVLAFRRHHALHPALPGVADNGCGREPASGASPSPSASSRITAAGRQHQPDAAFLNGEDGPTTSHDAIRLESSVPKVGLEPTPP